MVSIVIPTYGRKPEIVLRAVESVKNQTYTDWELYVVDDNKEDNPYSEPIRELLEEQNDTRIHYLRMEKNSGACAARNKGIQESKGEYVAFLDDDDEWYPQKLEKQIVKFEDPEVGFVYCGFFMFNEKKGTGKSSWIQFTKGDVYTRLLKGNFMGGTPGVIVRRNCFEKCGYFRDDMPSSQDYEMWLRLAKEYKVDSVAEDLVKVHLHEEDSITKSLDRRIEGFRKILDSYHEDIVKDKKIYSFQLYNLGKFLILNGQNKEGLQLLWNAIKIQPINSFYYAAVILYWKMME